MSNDLNTMVDIQTQAGIDHDLAGLPALDDETRELAEGKRFTFDVISVPVDPLR